VSLVARRVDEATARVASLRCASPSLKEVAGIPEGVVVPGPAQPF